MRRRHRARSDGHGRGCRTYNVLLGGGPPARRGADRRRLRGTTCAQIIDTPGRSLLAGCALRRRAARHPAGWRRLDSFEVFSFLVRLLHVLAAMVWVGLIVFVNFVQLVALQGADDQARGFLPRR